MALQLLYVYPTAFYLSKYEKFSSYIFIQIYLTIYILKKITPIVKVKKIYHLFLKALIKTLTYFILRKI